MPEKQSICCRNIKACVQAGILGILIGLLLVTVSLKSVVELLRVTAWPIALILLLIFFRREIKAVTIDFTERVVELTVGQIVKAKLVQRESKVKKKEAQLEHKEDELTQAQAKQALEETEKGNVIPLDQLRKELEDIQ